MNEKFVNVKNACTASSRLVLNTQRAFKTVVANTISKKIVLVLEWNRNLVLLAAYLIPKGATSFQTTITHYNIWIGDSSSTLGGLCKECKDLSQYSGMNNTRFGIKRLKEILCRTEFSLCAWIVEGFTSTLYIWFPLPLNIIIIWVNKNYIMRLSHPCSFASFALYIIATTVRYILYTKYAERVPFPDFVITPHMSRYKTTANIITIAY